MGQDSRGTYQRDLGWKEVDGQLRQHRFYLGKDRAQAMVRYIRLDDCWATVEKRWAKLPANNRPSRPLWDSVSLLIGQGVAKGEEGILIDPSDHFYKSASEPHEVDGVDGLVQTTTIPAELVDPVALLSWFNELQVDFHFVRIIHVGEWPHEARQKVQASARTFKAMGDGLNKLAHGGQTLHQALDAFSVHLGTKYMTLDRRTSQFGRAAQKQVRCIKEHADNRPLDGFGLHEIETIIDHWGNRPNSKRGKPVAVDTVKNTVKRFRQFLRWLHRSQDFDWRKPEDYEVLPVRVKLSPVERAKRVTQVAVYSADEVSIIWEHASPYERVFIALALNCGFGRAELGSLQCGEILLDKDHEFYKGLHGSFIRRFRGKTDIFGEWKLWPETVQAVEWFKAQRPDTSETAFLVTSSGKSFLTVTKGNNASGRIANLWSGLLLRIKKDHPSFRCLSFNKLRKTAGEMVRNMSDGEMMRIFHSRGQSVPSDSLADFYSNRPFNKLFDITDKIRASLADVFAKVPEPFPPGHKKSNPSLPLSKRKRIVDLRKQGWKYKAIAKELAIAIDTVRRYLRKAGA
jgi:integrase